VEKQGLVSACSYLLSFQKPEKSQISLGFQRKMKIQQGSLKQQQPSLGSVNVRIVFGQQSNRALSAIFVEASLIRIFTDGERVDLI